MGKLKRKIQPPPITANNTAGDSSDSDYNVEQFVKPTRTVVEEFPLPARLKRGLKGPLQNGAADDNEDSEEDESSDEERTDLPTLTTAQFTQVLQAVKNNKRFVLNIRNVAFTTSKVELEDHFRKAGRVKSVRIPKRRSAAFAFVEMLDAEGFQKAFLLDGSYLDGRQIRVQLSESGKKKSHSRLLLLEQKNTEIRKMRKKNRVKPEATRITLVPKKPEDVPVPRDPYLDKAKRKVPTKKEIKLAKKKTSMRAKFRNLEKKGITV